MKSQKNFRVWGLILIIPSSVFLSLNIIQYYVDDIWTLVSVLPILIGGILLGAGVGTRPSSDIYYLIDIQNGKRFQVLNDAWTQNPDGEGKTLLCKFPGKQHFLLYVGKSFYTGKEIDGKYFIKHDEKIYTD